MLFAVYMDCSAVTLDFTKKSINIHLNIQSIKIVEKKYKLASTYSDL